MKLLVTGYHGQLARCLADRASDHVVVHRSNRDTLDLSRPASVADQLRYLLDQYRPDAIANAAAFTQVDLAESQQTEAFAINADSVAELAAVAREAATPVIHVSTDYVFSGASSTPYLPSDPTGPTGVYGRSKLAGEAAIAASGADYAIIRTAWLYSAYGRNFVTTMLGLAERMDHVSVVDDQIGSPTSASDLADAVLAMLARWPEQGCRKIYHFAGAGQTSWAGFAAEIFRIAALEDLPAIPVLPISGADYPTAASRPAMSVLDSSAIERDFAVVTQPWQSSLRSVVRMIGQRQAADEKAVD